MVSGHGGPIHNLYPSKIHPFEGQLVKTLNSRTIIATAFVTCMGLASTAQSAVLTFEGIPGGTGTNFSSSAEAGFDLVVNGLYLDTGGNGAGGSANELEGLCCSSAGNLDVKRTGGGTFKFTSIDVELEYYSSPATVTLMGYLGGILQATDILVASGGYTTSPAVNLAGVIIDEIVVTGQRDFNGGTAFDNLRLENVIPLPGTLALLAPSLLGLACVRRRPQQ